MRSNGSEFQVLRAGSKAHSTFSFKDEVIPDTGGAAWAVLAVDLRGLRLHEWGPA